MIGFEDIDLVEMRKSLVGDEHVKRISYEELFKVQQEWEYIGAWHYSDGFKELIQGECGMLNGKVIALKQEVKQ